MGQESLAGMMKEIAKGAGGGVDVLTCTVSKASPLQLKFQGDKKTVLDKSVLIVPSHVSGLSKGKTVYVMAVGDGDSYFVLGRG